MPQERFLFLDLETTGLDPERCRIIEVACQLTDGNFCQIGAEFSATIRVPPDPLTAYWEHDAFLMHEKSGLIGPELDDKVLFEETARVLLHAWLRKNVGRERVNLAGNSVHFDRRFLEFHWPEVLPFLTHRHLDVSSLRLIAKARGVPLPEQPRQHRALDDVRASIEELRHWLKPGALETNAEVMARP